MERTRLFFPFLIDLSLQAKSTYNNYLTFTKCERRLRYISDKMSSDARYRQKKGPIIVNTLLVKCLSRFFAIQDIRKHEWELFFGFCFH